MKRDHDCDLLLEDAEKTLGSLGACINSALDENKSKTDVTKEVFGLGKHLLKLGYDTTKCAVKYTPKAIATASRAKRELSHTATAAYQTLHKGYREQKLEEKIRQLRDTQSVSGEPNTFIWDTPQTATPASGEE